MLFFWEGGGGRGGGSEGFVFPEEWSESFLSVLFSAVVWALGGCFRLCRFSARPGDWSSCNLSCAVWCVGVPPPRARGGPL